MKLNLNDITNKHKGQPALVSGHSPSLSYVKDKIENLQIRGELLRFSVNEWYDFFTQQPDYWVLSNSEYTIGASFSQKDVVTSYLHRMHQVLDVKARLDRGENVDVNVDLGPPSGDRLWHARGYPEDIFNKYKIPVLFNDTADLTEHKVIEEKLECDYLGYDARHFKGDSCFQVLKNFKEHYQKNKNLDFKYYGNNSFMWKKPDTSKVNRYCAKIHGQIGGGWARAGNCCHRIDKSRLTIQEYLQKISGHERHMSPGHTVVMFGIVFAVIMGCNPVYLTGMDLDYKIGYAAHNNETNLHEIQIQNLGNLGHWRHVYKNLLLDDMKILRESAELLGTKIINLNKNSWYDVFEFGNLPE